MLASDEYGGYSNELNFGENDVVDAAVSVGDANRQVQGFIFETLVVVDLCKTKRDARREVRDGVGSRGRTG